MSSRLAGLGLTLMAIAGFSRYNGTRGRQPSFICYF
ncbi:C4-dicarboxylate transporter [Proteus mirabilis]|uniref:C4-dicarboxylate transporter n=1 Tax=Proteus mirabilis TaxID=584 RepID=A0A379FH39_PROMI|nr:C4-dicarboxylate transporter [Proteus mirabilis]